MREIIKYLLAILICAAPAAAFAQPAGEALRGLWHDRAHGGHGLQFERIGNVWLAIFYTYGADGEPEWFLAQGALQGTRFSAPLLRFRYSAQDTPRESIAATVGELTLDFGANASAGNCSDGVDRSDVTTLVALDAGIDAEHLRWCMESTLPDRHSDLAATNGLWFGGASDSGWGLGTYLIPRGSVHQVVGIIFYYDANGYPRWAFGDGADTEDLRFALSWTSYRGYCRGCAPQMLIARVAGSATLGVVAPLAGAANTLDQTLRYPPTPESNFDRHGALHAFSDPYLLSPAVATHDGLLRGVVGADGLETWRGVPYAAAPTAALRWRAPQAPASRYATLAATAFGPGCPQVPAQGLFGTAPARQSEDCLSLNVWAPSSARFEAARRPVMVWIHGGGHIQGSSGELFDGRVVYDGAVFAARGAVYVSINYRLGALGYATIGDFIGEAGDQPGAGNYGFLDQVAALRWVHDNIAQFGGDPGNVTIFGESAGGVSVCALMASSLSRGLFQRAIMQSGNCLQTLPLLSIAVGTREAATAQGERLKVRLGCTAGDVQACLRGKGAQEIVVAAQGTIAFGSSGETYGEIQDGYAFTESFASTMRNGRAAPVPFMIGINEDEASVLVPTALRPPTAAAYEAQVRAQFPSIAEQVLARYPAALYTPVWRAYTAIYTDVAFICPAQRAARDHAARGNAVRAYYFTETLPQYPELGAFHALEISFLYTSQSGQSPALQALASRMKQWWSSYAVDGVPVADGSPAWPLHPTTGALGLDLNATATVARADYRKQYCDFWAQYVAL